MSKPPVFILGVPRSGTTLLRTLLDSHSAIACGPETPWLGGHQPRSVMELWRFLREHEMGYCASYGMSGETATAAARAMVSTLMDRYAAARGKTRWAEKTPDNVLHAEFLLELFPEARVIHLVRDGLDVAQSTSVVADHRRGISEFLERNLGFGPDAPAAENNPLTALLRWSHWNRLIGDFLARREHLKVRYERLVAEPEAVMRAVMGFIGEPFEPGMLEYAKFAHEFPRWEWGSADVRARGGITRERVGRARRELTPLELSVLEPIARSDRCPLIDGEAPTCDPAFDERLALTARYLQGFAGPLGLMPPGAQDCRDAAWLWLHGMSRVSWRGKRLVCVGDGHNGPAWMAALLGAEVLFVGRTGEPDPSLVRLRDGLRVRVDWPVLDPECPPAIASDAVVGVGIEPGRDTGVRELSRGLRSGGLFAVSYALRERTPNGAIRALKDEISGAFSGGMVVHGDGGDLPFGAALAIQHG